LDRNARCRGGLGRTGVERELTRRKKKERGKRRTPRMMRETPKMQCSGPKRLPIVEEPVKTKCLRSPRASCNANRTRRENPTVFRRRFSSVSGFGASSETQRACTLCVYVSPDPPDKLVAQIANPTASAVKGETTHPCSAKCQGKRKKRFVGGARARRAQSCERGKKEGSVG
jgi:hypothetical protein